MSIIQESERILKYKIKIKLLLTFIIYIYFLLFNISTILFALEVKTVVVVNNITISNIDLEKEIELIKILNDEKNLSNSDVKNAAINNLIDEILKKEEINKNNIYINLNNLNKDYKNFIESKKNNKLQNDYFRKILYNKIKIDYEWNALIMKDYGNNIDINMDEVEKKISQLNLPKELAIIEKEKIINQEKNKKISIYSNFRLNKIKNKSLIKIF